MDPLSGALALFFTLATFLWLRLHSASGVCGAWWAAFVSALLASVATWAGLKIG